MTFPFVIELEKKLNINGDLASTLEVFAIIQTFLESKSVSDFYKTGETIRFKKGFFSLNTNIFAIIDKGEFELIKSNDEYKLIYRFYLLRFFIISVCMSIVFGLMSGQLTAGIIAFVILCIGNFVICDVRQRRVIEELANKINKSSNITN